MASSDLGSLRGLARAAAISLAALVLCPGHSGARSLRPSRDAPSAPAQFSMTSQPVTTSIDGELSWDAPTAGADISDRVLSASTCEVTVRDPSAVQKVDFYLDGNPIGTATGAPYSCWLDTSSLTPGTHILKAEAIDFNGQSDSVYTYEETPWTSDPGTRVTVQGDSLTVGSWWRMPADLGSHYMLVSVSAHIGRSSVKGVLRLPGQTLGNVVVFALGTNDWWSTPAAYRERIDTVLQIAGRDRCVVLPTIWWNGKPNAALNRVLRSVARQYGPRRVQLAHWAAAAGSGNVLIHDGTHPANPASWQIRAHVVDDAVRACAAHEATPSATSGAFRF